jgi:uncharacterized protein (TIGR02145 family)
MAKIKYHSISRLILLTAFLLTTFLFMGQEIETVVIGKQEWMKFNLNIDVLGSTCYEEDSLNCEEYGRLYAWQAAIDACPDGFRLPTDDDWLILTETLGGADTAGLLLKTGGSSGFDAQLGGNFHPDVDMYSFKDLKGFYWTATPKSFYTAWIRTIATGQKNVVRDHIGKSFYFSVRCIKVK